MNLTTENVRDHVGATSFSRGKDYFTKGVVKQIIIEDNTIKGLVQGGQRDPYEVEMEVVDGEIQDSDCSCPVGFACKHVAALAMKAILVQIHSPDTKESVSKRIVPTKSFVPEPNWKKDLTLFLNPQTDEEDAIFQLQILLKLESYNNSLSLRPRVLDPTTGKTTITDLVWSYANWHDGRLYINNNRGSIPSKQLFYLQTLAAALNDGWLGRSWEQVPEKKARFIFQLLQQHSDYGVTLLGGQKGEIPVVIQQIPIEIKIAITEKGEMISISKKMYCQGQDITDKKVSLIGNPISFAIINQTSSYQIHPVIGENEGKQNFSSNNFVQSFPTSVTIPKSQISEFEANFLPELSKQYSLDIQTQSIHMPVIAFPKPVIMMKLEKKMRVKINFGLVYENTFLPLLDTPSIMTIDKKTVIFDQQKIRETRNILNQSLASFSKIHQQPVSFMSQEGIILDGLEAAKFSTEIIPMLQKVLPDLDIQTADDLPDFTLDTSEPEIILNVEENELEHDWFDLGISVLVGKEKVPFYLLFSALVEDQEYLLLDSGRYFSLKSSQFDKLRKLIAETKSIRETAGEKLQISRFQAGLWEELQKLGVVSQQAEKWQQTMTGLLDIKSVKLAKIPSSLAAKLRPYQHEGYSWLKFLRDYNLGGILADDMGLGKTIQTISLILSFREQKKKKKNPFLVIAPTSVVENWDAELEKFAPTLNRLILRAGNRQHHYENISKADVVVTSYALLVRDFDQLKKQPFDTVILDEAQMVKNYQSRAYSLVRQIQSESKIALTGTPLENNLMELWSIFSIVAPGLFPGPKNFQELYRTPIEKHQDSQALQKLRSRIRPFMMRRQKAIVEKQLPAKNEQVIYLNLNEKHRYLYDLQLQHERKRILGLLQDGGLKQHRFEILRSLMKMRQMCLHPHLVDDKHIGIPATKIEALREYIEQLVSENHRILIFSQFTSFLSKVKEVLHQSNVEYLYLDGQTKNRGELVKKFQTGNVPIFVISLKSGGFGLNLTAADYCILLDPWWNPAVEQQAIDRTHRIGQTKPVFVYKMIAKDTIEEKVLQLQQKKRQLFKNILEDGDIFGSVVTEADIKNIFEI